MALTCCNSVLWESTPLRTKSRLFLMGNLYRRAADFKLNPN